MKLPLCALPLWRVEICVDFSFFVRDVDIRVQGMSIESLSSRKMRVMLIMFELSVGERSFAREKMASSIGTWHLTMCGVGADSLDFTIVSVREDV